MLRLKDEDFRWWRNHPSTFKINHQRTTRERTVSLAGYTHHLIQASRLRIATIT